MRKFTDFIIDKRYLILVIFIILAIISAIASTHVVINYDMAKYLPSTSETRIGMDIMEEEFAGTETSSLNIMFKGLNEQEKTEICEWIENCEGVDYVDYDETEEYNKDDYTLYVINVDDDDESETASNVYNAVTEQYEDYEFEVSGNIANKNKVVLPTWIVGLAVLCALVILIFMCESYAEPILFLTAILMAVLLNSGTNIIFSSVSNVTSSITAILQLALSMDYSIMLMNRYNQEKEKEKDNKKAMKNALYYSFKSISSSSVTTIVGLLALVFMSFTIGRDLGFVLAKGVLFSLISIFFVLPALILIFEKWIIKTKKKSPALKLDWLGKFSYKFRSVALFVFIGVFIFSFIMKGNLKILYTDSEDNAIAEVFDETNQIAVIYRNEDEGKIRNFLDKIEANEKVDEVLAYGNTIDQELTYEELNEKLNDLGADVDIESYLLKILYYNYYNQDERNKMTLGEFVNFIETEVYTEETMNEQIDAETRKDVERLKKFTSEPEINKQRTTSEIAKILEMDKSDVDDILVYYNSKNNDLRISLNQFINFMNTKVLTNAKYASSIDNKTLEDLNTLSKYTSIDTIQRKMSSAEMANLFGMNANTMTDLYKYYVSVGNIDARMTISEFSNFVLNDVLNSEYAGSFNEETINNIRLLNTFSNPAIITKEMLSAELANLFGIDENTVTQLLFLKYSTLETGSTLSISEFINNVIYIKNNTNYLTGTDLSSLEQISFFSKNESNINITKLNKAGLANIFDSIRTNFVENIYLLTGLQDDYQMTPQEFISFVLNMLDKNTVDGVDSGVFSVDEATLNNLKLLKLVIDDSVSANKTQYTATQLSQILGINKTQTYQLYALINMVQKNTTTWTSTPNDFVALILANSSNPQISGSIDEATMSKLTLLSNIMSSSLSNNNYNYSELATLIGIDASSIKSIYTLYMTNTVNISLTPHEFVDFVLAHKDDSTLSSNLTANTISDLRLVQSVMFGVESGKMYTSAELSTLLGSDKEKLDLLYGLYVSTYINPNQTKSLKQFVGFLLSDVITNADYSDNFDNDSMSKLESVNGIMDSVLKDTKFTKEEIFSILSVFTDSLDKNMIDLLYVYFGSTNEFDETWTMTVQDFVNFLNNNILNDTRFDDFLKDDMRQNIIDSKETIQDAKDMLLGKQYSRMVLNTKFDFESEETFEFIQELKDLFGASIDEIYVIGDSPMAYEMSQTFEDELNFITILTMIAIFVVVAITFKSVIVSIILVLTIQCAVYLTMGILSLSGGTAYFIALLIVQSILMGATIDYAILYTSYYIEHRRIMQIKEAIINSYNKSIHTILTSSSILVIVTLIVGYFSSAITSKICTTISQGTFCSTLIILFILPAVIAGFDKIIVKKKK